MNTTNISSETTLQSIRENPWLQIGTLSTGLGVVKTVKAFLSDKNDDPITQAINKINAATLGQKIAIPITTTAFKLHDPRWTAMIHLACIVYPVEIITRAFEDKSHTDMTPSKFLFSKASEYTLNWALIDISQNAFGLLCESLLHSSPLCHRLKNVATVISYSAKTAIAIFKFLDLKDSFSKALEVNKFIAYPNN